MNKKIIPFMAAMAVLTSGCADSSEQTSVNSTTSAIESSTTEAEQTDASTAEDTIQEEVTEATEPQYADSASDMFTNRDYEIGYDETDSVEITLSGSSAVCNSESVKIDGGTITITDEGTYIIRGTLDDGMIIVDAEETDKPQIVLDGASVTNSTSAALYVLHANKVFVTVEEGTENLLANGGTFQAIDDNNIDAALFTKQDVTFNGSGTLKISSPSGHGISGKDDLAFTSGIYSIESGLHGIDANNSVRLANSVMNIESGNDGIHAENSDDTSLGFVYALSGNYTINAAGDGMSAGSYMQIENGTYDIISGGGSVNAEEKTSDMGMMGGGMMGHDGMMGGRRPGGYGAVTVSASAFGIASSDSSTEEDTSVSTKGIKAVGNILINSGEITVDSADDSVHSDASFTMNSGSLTLTSGDDGIHANETLTVNDGTINITDSYEGIEGLNILVNGGDITLTASDDGFNAAGGNDSSGFGGFGGGGDMFGGGHGGMGGGSASNGSVTITGGNVYIQASGDGLDSNGTLEISGGEVTVCGPTNGDTAVLDYDVSGIINGGTFIGTGSYMMAQTLSSSEQGVIAVSVGQQEAGTLITIEDSDGDVLISAEPELPFQIIILSSPDFEKGETYKLTVGSESAEFEAN